MQFIDQQKVAKKWLPVEIDILSNAVRNVLYYLSSVRISQNVQNKIQNLQIRFEKFTDQTERAQKYQFVGIEISINDNTKSPQT